MTLQNPKAWSNTWASRSSRPLKAWMIATIFMHIPSTWRWNKADRSRSRRSKLEAVLYHLQSFLAQQLNTSWTICKIKCAINITVKQCDFNIHLNKTLTSKFRIRFVSFFFLCESCLFSSQLWWIPGRPEPAKETKIPNIFAACPATETSDDISVPFANCRPNWRHSEYYSCQTD